MAGQRYYTGTPGLAGAISDAASAVRKATVGDPKTGVGRGGRQRSNSVDSAVDQAAAGDDGTRASNAGRQAQSSDASNGY